ncbi:Hypothetical protein FKW44_013804 [Caligus rogercresseyi]|uniref:Uncharacterized protein n=1 Tax=Caligus rogercresseyi TaxID=217165 RepID=A0A7T8GYV3_CALRO|nr:Hypothetical protein FKW44_013804 [Caligus rogercresseyi]
MALKRPLTVKKLGSLNHEFRTFVKKMKAGLILSPHPRHSGLTSGCIKMIVTTQKRMTRRKTVPRVNLFFGKVQETFPFIQLNSWHHFTALATIIQP